MIDDLNDFYYFCEIVRHGGIAAAERATREPKSKLSRRLAQLEDRLGVRLVERSTRRFRVTEIGQNFYQHCCNMVMEAERARAVVATVRDRPSGLVRFACPTGMMETVSPYMATFLASYPDVRLEVIAGNSPVDLIADRIDVALRVRYSSDGDASLTMRALASSRRILVASPLIATQVAGETHIDCLGGLPLLAVSLDNRWDTWQLTGPGNIEREWHFTPRLICAEYAVVRAMAVAGVGVGLIPDHFAAGEIADGRLVRILPDWCRRPALVHLVFTSKRGLTPAVRALIDHLAIGFKHDKSMDPPSAAVREPAPAPA